MSDKLSDAVDSTVGAGTSDKVKGTTHEKVGQAKQILGEATGDKKLEHEGKMEELKGAVHVATGHMKEAAEKVVDAIKDGAHHLSEAAHHATHHNEKE